MQGIDCGSTGLSLLENPKKKKKRNLADTYCFFLNVVYPALEPDVTSGRKGKALLNFLVHKEECSNKSVLSTGQCFLSTKSATAKHTQAEADRLPLRDTKKKDFYIECKVGQDDFLDLFHLLAFGNFMRSVLAKRLAMCQASKNLGFGLGFGPLNFLDLGGSDTIGIPLNWYPSYILP